MRLLSTTKLTLSEFTGSDIPVYAILSHTWGADSEEVVFTDIGQGPQAWAHKKGAAKVEGFCRVAAENGYEWAWIDTCCIDKSSSAELSEAINSMYQWYRESHVCYVYLSDVPDMDHFHRSRWFTRGWTLQELMAPRFVDFYSADWEELCNKSDYKHQIATITGIEEDAIAGSLQPERYTIGVRMSWAAKRTTKRIEDMAYSLLGICGVNMPLLYGEGTRAFQRLQEEILKTTEDYSLFAWNDIIGNNDLLNLSMRLDVPPTLCPLAIFASTPANFDLGASILPNSLVPVASDHFGPKKRSLGWPNSPRLSYTDSGEQGLDEPPRITARGLRVTLPFLETVTPRHTADGLEGTQLAFLYLAVEQTGWMVCLALRKSDDLVSSVASGEFYRPRRALTIVKADEASISFRTVYIRTKPLDPVVTHRGQRLWSLDYWSRNEVPFTTCVLYLNSALRVVLGSRQARTNLDGCVILQHGRYLLCLRFVCGLSIPGCLLQASESEPGRWLPGRYGDSPEEARLEEAFRGQDRKQSSECRLPNDQTIQCTIRRRPSAWLTGGPPQSGNIDLSQARRSAEIFSLEVTVSKNDSDSPELKLLETIRLL